MSVTEDGQVHRARTRDDARSLLLPVADDDAGSPEKRGGDGWTDRLHDTDAVAAHHGRWLRSPLYVLHLMMRALRHCYRVPAMATVYLLLLATLGTGIYMTLRYVLNPDKGRVPWRTDCAKQPLFDNLEAAKLAPTDVFVGVFSVDNNVKRRQLIRDTYATHTLPRHAETGHLLGNVQLRFVLARPQKRYAQLVALEQEMYNDLVFLDMDETQSSKKTHAFFKWATENATVPILVGGNGAETTASVRWKLADYVLKSDDDTFIMLDELERRLRVLPRTGVYWGCACTVHLHADAQILLTSGSWVERCTRSRTTLSVGSRRRRK